MAAPGSAPVVFLPGWGCSGRMLSLCGRAGPWWSISAQLDPVTLLAELEALVRSKGWPRLILVGWSLGARLALEFASRNPSRIEALVLLSLRRDWPESEVAAIRGALTSGPKAFLKDFYRKCFLGHKEAWRQFVEQLQETQLGEMDLRVLERGLALLQRPLAPVTDALVRSGFPMSRVWLVHGESDIIAPCRQRLQLAGARQIILKHEGHALFLVPAVRRLSNFAGPWPVNDGEPGKG